MPPLHHTDAAGEPIVEWRTTRLDANDTKLTTLSALYQSVQIILEANGIKDFDEAHRVNRPSDTELAKAYTLAADWWTAVATNVEPIAEGIRNPWMIPEYRKYNERWSLLFRPVAQVALFWGLMSACRRGLDLGEALRRANRVNWRASDPMWVDTVIRANGHMNARSEGIRLAGRLIDYLIAADRMDDEEKSALRRDLSDARDYPVKLPRPVK